MAIKGWIALFSIGIPTITAGCHIYLTKKREREERRQRLLQALEDERIRRVQIYANFATMVHKRFEEKRTKTNWKQEGF